MHALVDAAERGIPHMSSVSLNNVMQAGAYSQSSTSQLNVSPFFCR